MAQEEVTWLICLFALPGKESSLGMFSPGGGHLGAWGW